MNKLSKFLIVAIAVSSLQLVCMQDDDMQSRCSVFDTLKARWQFFPDTAPARNKKMAEAVQYGYSDEYIQALICANKSLISRRQPAVTAVALGKLKDSPREAFEDEEYKTPYRAIDWAVSLGKIGVVRKFLREYDLKPWLADEQHFHLMKPALESVAMTHLLLKSDIDLEKVEKFHSIYSATYASIEYCVLPVPSLSGPGRPYYLEALKAYRARQANLNSEKSK